MELRTAAVPWMKEEFRAGLFLVNAASYYAAKESPAGGRLSRG